VTPTVTELDPQLAEALEVVNANGELLLLQLREMRLQCDRTEATLRLLVGFLATSSDIDASYLLYRVARDMRTCAERPDLAAKLACCEERVIEPAMILAAASVIFGEDREAPAELTGRSAAAGRLH